MNQYFQFQWFWVFVAIVLRLMACLLYYFLLEPTELQAVVGMNYGNLGTDGHFQIAKTLWISGEYAYAPGGFPVHNRPPLHPFLMFLTSAWSDKYWFFLWFLTTSLLGGISAWLMFKITQLLSFSPKDSKFLVVLTACHPYLIYISRSTTFISLAIVMLLSFWHFWWKFLRFKQLNSLVFSGIFAGLCILTHGTFQLLLPFGFIWLLFHSSFRNALLFCWVSIAVVFPWSLRNYLVLEKPLFLVSGSGMQYWKGEESVFPEKVDIYRKVFENQYQQELQIAYFGTVKLEDDQKLWDLALKDIADNPGKMLYRYLYGFVIFFFPHETGFYKGFFTFFLNFPLLLIFIYRCIKPNLSLYRKSLALYLLMVANSFAFFAPHASYVVMFYPLFFLFIPKSEGSR